MLLLLFSAFGKIDAHKEKEKQRKEKLCKVQFLIQVFQTGCGYFLGACVEYRFASRRSVKISANTDKTRGKKKAKDASTGTDSQTFTHPVKSLKHCRVGFICQNRNTGSKSVSLGIRTLLVCLLQRSKSFTRVHMRQSE